MDTEILNPRVYSDNLGKMFCFHNRYNLGDEHDYKHTDYRNWKGFLRQLKKDYNIRFIKPLYMIDHSSLSVSTSPFHNTWDSGQIGFILVTKEDAEKEFGPPLQNSKA